MKAIYIIRSVRFLIVCGGLCGTISCGSAIGDSQVFVPNKEPIIESVGYVRADGAAIDRNNLISDMVFLLTIRAEDPEKKNLSYSFSSDFGSFTPSDTMESGATVKFVTGSMKAGDVISLTVFASDPKGAKDSYSLTLGTAKPVPKITVSPATVTILAADTATINLSADCDGVFQLVCNDVAASGSDIHIDTSENVFHYAKGGGALPAVIAGPTASETGRLKLPSAGVHKVWVIFSDALFQEDVKLCTVTVE